MVADVGAYGLSMASQYNMRPLPAEVLVDKRQVKVIRNAQKYKDLTRNFPK